MNIQNPTKNVFWLLDLTIVPDELHNFETLMLEMVPRVRETEPGAQNYEWYLSEDHTVCHLFERYTDSDAAVKHVSLFFQHYAQRFFTLTKPNRMVVYGDVSDELKSMLSKANAEFMIAWNGFSR